MLQWNKIIAGCKQQNPQSQEALFQNIPEDEPALLITVTVNDDKVVSNIQALTTSNTVVNNLALEPTTPAQFKQKLESLFASQQ